MIYLIVPPIIIVIAAAILVVFLAKVIPSNTDGGGSFILKDSKRKKKAKKDTTSRAFSRFREKVVKEEKKAEKGSNTGSSFKNVVAGSASVARKVTQGIVSDNKTKDKIVSLRKKSIVSDKIENAQGRNPEELRLMKEIESDPQNSKKYEQLGDYYMEQESFKDARDCYKYVLRLDPRHRRAQVAMKNLDRVLE